MQAHQRPIRIVLAKIGLDGHDRGIKLVARALRDAGMEVIYTGLWQTPEMAVRAVEEEDADVLGVSLLSGAHQTLVPSLMRLLRERGLEHVLVLVGGIVPVEDVPALEAAGVARIFGPGAPLDGITEFVQHTAGRPLPRRFRRCYEKGPDGSTTSPAGTTDERDTGRPAAGISESHLEELVARFQHRDRGALAHLLSHLEDGELSSEFVERLAAGTRRPMVVGITGSAGVGKSTLIASLARHVREQGHSVAVLACDPQSPKTGGALLGDRVRLRIETDDAELFFRSVSTRGATGGVAGLAGPAVPLLGAFGFECVLIETVGVGQDQVGVRRIAERVVLLVSPGTGDEVQWQKAGLLEVADLVVVNKADLPGAEELRGQLRSALSLGGAPAPPVLLTVASRGEGVAELWDQLREIPSRS